MAARPWGRLAQPRAWVGAETSGQAGEVQAGEVQAGARAKEPTLFALRL